MLFLFSFPIILFYFIYFLFISFSEHRKINTLNLYKLLFLFKWFYTKSNFICNKNFLFYASFTIFIILTANVIIGRTLSLFHFLKFRMEFNIIHLYLNFILLSSFKKIWIIIYYIKISINYSFKIKPGAFCLTTTPET